LVLLTALGSPRRKRLPEFIALGSALLTVLLAVATWLLVPRPVFWRAPWAEAAGIGAGLYVDDIGLLFVAAVTGVSLLSLLYSVSDIPHMLRGEPHHSGRAIYYSAMLVFIGAMLGLVLAADLVQIYVFWELTGIASFVLIGIRWNDSEARAGAVKALLVTGTGGFALLAGLLVMGSTLDTFSLREVLQSRELLSASPVFGVVLLLLLVGAVAKSAQFPLHVWLPDAMVAPTPVSAFLHSAALVAAGFYLLVRFFPLFAGSSLWTWSVIGVGAASTIVGGMLAMKASGLKELLAYSTISQYGLMFVLLGLGTAEALAAALFTFLQHGLIKAGLFFAAGILTYVTGHKVLGKSGGIWAKLPTTFTVATVLGLSLGGLPPLAGFWVKEGLLASVLSDGKLPLVALVVVASALTFAYILRFLRDGFIQGTPSPARIKPVPSLMLTATALLALLTLVFGLMPGLASAVLVEPAVMAVLGQPADLHLNLHVDLTLFLSVLALSMGVIAFALFRYFAPFLVATTRTEWSLDRLYCWVASNLRWAGRRALRLQNGSLQLYVRFCWLGMVVLVAISLVPLTPESAAMVLGANDVPSSRGLVDVGMALLLTLIVIGTVLTFVVRRHIHVVLTLSAVGYLIAGVFAMELAPDVGLVQVHVETLVTVLFVLAIVLIPRVIRQPFVLHPRVRLTAWTVALASISGFGSAWLSWLAINHLPSDPIAPWYNEYAPQITHIEDVVAAVLVSFRALDTLGEITVFAAAAIGVLALVRLIQRETG